jgi:hypothetical protein
MVAALLVALLASDPARGAEGASLPGAAPPATRSPTADLETAWASAISAYRGGDYERSVQALEALVASIEAAPPGAVAAGQWTRAMLRLAQAEATVGRTTEARTAMERVAALDPDAQPDPAVYPPSYRRQFEEVRRAVGARPRHRLTITSPAPGGTAWLHGRRLGSTPATVDVPAGRFRVRVTWGGTAEAAEWIELGGDPAREVTLAVTPVAALESVPAPSGPSSASPADGGAPAAAPTAILPAEPSLPADARLDLAGPTVPSGAPRQADPAAGPATLSADKPAPGSRGWMGPTAIATGGVALASAGAAVWQGLAAAQAQRDAQAMVRPDGTLVPGASPVDYAAAVARYDSARTYALVAGGVAVAMTAASVVLWVLLDEPPAPGGPALRF